MVERGKGADRQAVERSNPHAGHGAKRGVRESWNQGLKREPPCRLMGTYRIEAIGYAVAQRILIGIASVVMLATEAQRFRNGMNYGVRK